MTRVARRLAPYAAVVWAAVTLNFLIPHLAPGDPIDLFSGEANSLTAEERDRLRADYALDGSVVDQYGRMWGRLARGDLGTSVRHSRPVAHVLADRLPWTLALVGSATAISTGIGVLAGAFAARRRGRRRDLVCVAGLMALDSMPAFWIGMVLVAAFAVHLGWLPSFGAVPLDAAGTGAGALVEMGRRLVLPVASLVLATVGTTFLLARGAMVSALDAPYVHLAEAAGLPPRRIVYHHALRNALLPVSTHLAVTVGTLLSGAVVVETVFAYPGLGRVTFEAVQARDYALLQGAFLMVTVAVVVANALADLVYPRLDPRVRRAGMVEPA